MLGLGLQRCEINAYTHAKKTDAVYSDIGGGKYKSVIGVY